MPQLDHQPSVADINCSNPAPGRSVLREQAPDSHTKTSEFSPKRNLYGAIRCRLTELDPKRKTEVRSGAHDPSRPRLICRIHVPWQKKVQAYSRFVEAPEAPCSALKWFRDQDLAPNEQVFDWGVALYFSRLGHLHHNSDGSIDTERSPVVAVHVPRVRRRILWTDGEVRFCPLPLGRFPELERLRRSFLQWFEKHPLIYDHHAAGEYEFDYYLEGSTRNWGPIRAFPSGLAALKNGQYFISRLETNGSLEILRRTLALRGVICADQD